MLYISPVFSKYWKPENAFDKAIAQQGVVYREKEGRRTLSFSEGGSEYFLKLHQGVGWGEIIKNLLMLRKPILGAENEYLAIQYLEGLRLDTMTCVAYGHRGQNPAKQTSFLVTEALQGMESLEDICLRWPEAKPSLAFKRQIVCALGGISKRFHDAGLNHRDYYLCHFLLDESVWKTGSKIKLHMIDLHRVAKRDKPSYRWVLKDISGLYFSALDVGFTQRDFFRFMKIYTGKSLRLTLQEDGRFWSQVHDKAWALHAKHHRKMREI